MAATLTQKQTHTIDPKLQPWVEKYRPKTIDDVSSQDNTVAVLRKALMSTNLPHMLFYGPPGTGKTSTILALARQLFGPDLFKSRVLELNASDERGISVVREKIKTFARETPRHNPGVASDGKEYPCPPYKLIILDEADSMTQDAQSALRRIMETYSRITRFCLVCNYVTRIIEPVASRCSKFRFRPLEQSSSQARMEMIAENEGVQADPGVLELILQLAGGDLRKAITYLQTAQRLHQASDPPTPITAMSGKSSSAPALPTAFFPLSYLKPSELTAVHEISGVVSSSVIDNLLRSMGIEPGSGLNPTLANGFEGVRKAVRSVGREGWSTGQVLEQVHDALIPLAAIPTIAKSNAALAIAECDKALCEGGDEELQLLECCLRIKEAMDKA
ncbi:DNA replication factor (activator 1 subunit) [Trichosporon asahii var. asahii CBS 2479]|uniref:Replication factor C subunit 2 n=1 Tax=Trichosporon asahii var. asahii (strain ATCC 90039 / CBS 2479 / JCM 2466 / KCTC 7840 / NBRC 103889/ NCYC 2677 / UAMH 7654) TaxID=1186058 RepID=J6EUN2_TRIAS|nr:DNA replication factor (activator 1 subunit) [Trichosporon asahii var. asahii CBS 2479]EJT48309.1 DNA replication factor (activator 1 subunit) [Trichosporon asahii var. asahii CBS 2479]